MIILSNEQKNKIRNLKPLTDSNFEYNKSRWSNLNINYINEINEFEDKKISRLDVINAYKEYFENNSKGYMKAFLLTMVWGFGNTGYGTHRTNIYISTEENRMSINIALDFINNYNHDSLKKAFKQLTKIKGLGISYITKVLYFATKAKGINEYALIFDIRVATALVKQTIPREVFEIVEITPSTKFKDYELFNNLIHTIATKNELEAEQVEMYLFNLNSE